MSRAFRCDRCGAYYDKPPSHHVSKMECYGAISVDDEDYDLCAGCLASFDEWMDEHDRRELQE